MAAEETANGVRSEEASSEEACVLMLDRMLVPRENARHYIMDMKTN